MSGQLARLAGGGNRGGHLSGRLKGTVTAARGAQGNCILRMLQAGRQVEHEGGWPEAEGALDGFPWLQEFIALQLHPPINYPFLLPVVLIRYKEADSGRFLPKVLDLVFLRPSVLKSVIAINARCTRQ